MNDKRPAWSDPLKESPFEVRKFTQELADGVEAEIRKRRQAPSGLRRSGRRQVITAALAGVLALGALAAIVPQFVQEPKSPAGLTAPAGERLVYDAKGNKEFTVYPEPGLIAGQQAGYLFQFTAPFSEFAGKRLSIQALHALSGLEVAAVREETVTAPSPGYKGLERWTAAFTLPLSGLWRLAVKLDGQAYGDVVVSVSEGEWSASPLFAAGPYQLRGIAGRAGFIDPGFKAGQSNKYMWHFWGSDRELQGEFRVLAVKQGTDKLIEVFRSGELGGALNGADRHVPSTMSLPESGNWRLLAFIGDMLFESIVVQVQP
ncbi:DUF4871 domain-containing protein [Paenibacillus filicis]|uniref:DUF4871 domain-containing protein n=1 Tax=Paenibacillus filicis TaxID=669464 RepID=A0ABU9DHS9_9BACL